MVNKFFNYAGIKKFFIGQFKEIESSILKENKIKVYSELFLGSGILFLNSSDSYEKYILNDKNPYVILIFKAFQNFNYNDFVEHKENIFSQFGDIKNNKEIYYEFRNWVNEEFKKNKENLNLGFYYYFLANSCINSLFRVGPNGFNQSYGNRFSFVDKIDFEYIHSKLKRAELNCTSDYSSFIKDDGKELIFLDPPYYEPQTERNVGYSFSKGQYLNFIDTLKNIKNSFFIYTDTLKKENEFLTNRMNIREMRDIAPIGDKNVTENEYAFLSDNINFREQKLITNKLF